MTDVKPQLIPGLILTCAIAAAAYWLHQIPVFPFTIAGRHPLDAMLVAIILGAAIRNLLSLPNSVAGGVRYSVHGLLPLAIVLLGARLNFLLLLDVSAMALLISTVGVVVTVTGCMWMASRIGVGPRLGVLLGVGTAICGGTAIAVTAPIIEAEETETAFAVATANVLGLAWIFVFPLVGTLLSLPQTTFGVWAGTSIHATPQVMAAGFAYGAEAGEVALIVKLVRILLLAPCVVLLGVWQARRKHSQDEAYVRRTPALITLFPPFILGFAVLAAAQNMNLLPDFTLQLQNSLLWEAQEVAVPLDRLVTTIAGFLVTMAMAGVGLGVNVRRLSAVGRGAFGLGLVAAVVLAGLSLTLTSLLV